MKMNPMIVFVLFPICFMLLILNAVMQGLKRFTDTLAKKVELPFVLIGKGQDQKNNIHG